MNHNSWEGEKVRLRGVVPEDWRHFMHGDADSDAQRHGWQVWPPQGEEAAKEFAKQQSLKKPDGVNFFLVIETLAGQFAGSISVRGDQRRFNFEYGISVNREHWGRGYAEEALRLLFRYMFGELRMHKAHAYVYAFNERSQAMHRKLGMVEEGRLREAQFTDGKFWDILVYGLTEEEFFEAERAREGKP